MTRDDFEGWMLECGFDTLEAVSIALGGPGGRTVTVGTVSRWLSGARKICNDVVARYARAMLEHPDLLESVRNEVAQTMLKRKRSLRLVGPADDPPPLDLDKAREKEDERERLDNER
jgi:hypothetical protein